MSIQLTETKSRLERLKVLLVDDHEIVLRTLTAILERHGLDVKAMADVAAALESISRDKFDVLLSDLNVGQPGDGFTVVSAMRRVQPDASTFILTGYPDFESAITAIRNQVDDYFAKPVEITKLLDAIRSVRQGRKPVGTTAPTTVAALLRERNQGICQQWLTMVLEDQEVSSIPLTDAERLDHIPEVLEELARCLESGSSVLSGDAVAAARAHGILRHQQGYSIPQILAEARVLQTVLSDTIQQSLLQIDLSRLAPDILTLGRPVQNEVETSVAHIKPRYPVRSNPHSLCCTGLRIWLSRLCAKALCWMPMMRSCVYCARAATL